MPDRFLRGGNVEAATWLAYVGLGGRYAVASRPDKVNAQWLRWDGTRWRLVDTHVVKSAARRALSAHYDRRLEAGAGTSEVIGLTRCLDVRWAWALVWHMRPLVTINVTEDDR